jgi:hypothetical protein
MSIDSGLQGAAAGSSAGPWGAVAGGVIGGMLGGSGEDAAAKAAADNLAYQKQWNSQVDPLSASGQRGQYAGKLNTMLTGGANQMFNDPNFKAQQEQGMTATQRMMNAMGMGISTNDTLALQQQSYTQANSFFNQQYDRLATLANAGGGGGSAPQGMSPGTAGNFATGTAQNYASAAGGIFGGISSLFGNKSSGPTTHTPQDQTSDYSVTY